MWDVLADAGRFRQVRAKFALISGFVFLISYLAFSLAVPHLTDAMHSHEKSEMVASWKQ